MIIGPTLLLKDSIIQPTCLQVKVGGIIDYYKIELWNTCPFAVRVDKILESAPEEKGLQKVAFKRGYLDNINDRTALAENRTYFFIGDTPHTSSIIKGTPQTTASNCLYSPSSSETCSSIQISKDQILVIGFFKSKVRFKISAKDFLVSGYLHPTGTDAGCQLFN